MHITVFSYSNGILYIVVALYLKNRISFSVYSIFFWTKSFSFVQIKEKFFFSSFSPIDFYIYDVPPISDYITWYLRERTSNNNNNEIKEELRDRQIQYSVIFLPSIEWQNFRFTEITRSKRLNYICIVLMCVCV